MFELQKSGDIVIFNVESLPSNISGSIVRANNNSSIIEHHRITAPHRLDGFKYSMYTYYYEYVRIFGIKHPGS